MPRENKQTKRPQKINLKEGLYAWPPNLADNLPMRFITLGCFRHLCRVLGHIPEGHSKFWILHGRKKISGSLKIPLSPGIPAILGTLPCIPGISPGKLPGVPTRKATRERATLSSWLSSGFSLWALLCSSPSVLIFRFFASSHPTRYEWNLIVVLMCIPLVTKDADRLFFFLNYPFTYFWLRWIFVVSHSFLQLQQAGATLPCRARASHCGGSSCCGARAPECWGFLSCGIRTLESGLSSCGTQA